MSLSALPEMPAAPVMELQGQRKRFTVPIGLKCLLEEMSREVLRHQPENICSFLANYLEAKLLKQCGGLEEGLDSRSNNDILKYLEEHRVTFTDANKYATLIQSAFRGFRDRKDVKTMKSCIDQAGWENMEEYEGEGDDLCVLDYNGVVAAYSMREIEKILTKHDITLEEAEKSAIMIQKYFRAHRSREKLANDDPETAAKLNQIQKRLRQSRMNRAKVDEEEGEDDGWQDADFGGTGLGKRTSTTEGNEDEDEKEEELKMNAGTVKGGVGKDVQEGQDPAGGGKQSAGKMSFGLSNFGIKPQGSLQEDPEEDESDGEYEDIEEEDRKFSQYADENEVGRTEEAPADLVPRTETEE